MGSTLSQLLFYTKFSNGLLQGNYFGIWGSTTNDGITGIIAHDVALLKVAADMIEWWAEGRQYHEAFNITQDDFQDFPFRNGFNKGDIMILYGVDGVNIGDVVVFWGGKKEPIIHRVVKEWNDSGEIFFQTKGDNIVTNKRSIQLYVNVFGMTVPKGTEGAIKVIDETGIAKKDVVGKAIFRVPYLGYIKIWFIDLLTFLHIVN